MFNSKRPQRRVGTCDLIDIYAPKSRNLHVSLSPLCFLMHTSHFSLHRSIKIATTTQSSSQTLANLQTALPAIIANIRGGWNNVQSLHLKTNDSVALPLWTCGLGEEDRWDGLVKDDEAMKEEGGSVSEDEMDVDEVVEEETPKKSKGKKRPPEEDTQEEEKPKKKVKGAQSLSQVTPNSPVQVTKQKRKASLIPDPVLTRKEREDPIPVAADDDLSMKKIRRKSSVGVADAPKAIDTLSIDTVAEVDVDTEALEPSSKLKKTNRKSKSRTSLDTVAEGISTATAHPLPVSISEPKPEGAQVNPKKRKKARESVDAPMLLEPIEIVPPQTLTAAEASTIDLPPKTPKHNKKAKAKAKAKLADAAPEDSISVLAPTKATSDAPAENDKKRKRKSKAPAGDEPTKDAPASVISVDNTVASTLADTPKEGEKEEKKAKAAGSDSATDAISTSLLDKSVVPSLTGASEAGEKKVKRPKAAGSTLITDVRPSSSTDISEAPTLTSALKEGKTKVKKSKATSSEPVVAVTPSLFSNNPTVSTLAGAPKGSDKMSKKSKTASSEPIDVTPLLVLDELTVTADAPNDGQKKKKKRTKVKSAATADSTKDTLNTTTSSTGNNIPASFNKSKDGEEKMKKTVKTLEVGDITSAIPPSTGAPGGDGQEKRKKVKAGVDAEPTHDRTPVTSDAANIPQDSSTKKSRKEKKKMQSSHTDVDVPAPSISGALSKEELKQKRLAEGGERKKDKAVRKSGKSAKDAVLGRKAGQA